MRDGKGIHVPPKELQVLRLLLGSAGSVISKDHLLDRVWSGIDAAEESLTRCIYALRKLLKDNKDFIATVYGQGYRFTCPVAVVDPSGLVPATVPSLAVLAFRGVSEANALDMQDAVIRQLTTAFGAALRVVPSGLMAEFDQRTDARDLVRCLMPDFYLSGRCTRPGEQAQWSVELIRGSDHVLLHGQILGGDGLGEALAELTCLVAQRLPGLRPSGSFCTSYPAVVAYLNGLCSVQRHTPQSLRDALVQFQYCLQLDERYAAAWCGVADAWLGKAMLGLCEQERAIDGAHSALSRALSLDPDSAQALPRLALLTSLRGCDDAAQVLFRRCLLTADQADVHYLHAWHHWFWRRNDQAAQSIDKCLRHDSNCVRAKILRVRITLTENPHEVMFMARKTLQQDNGRRLA
ncbi:winged helix-turn-helix domain-containing protein [Pseudomonas sp. QTF5]|uniref:winged helix-turn-helix domain-containing protein n=1 Tax=Pseudomonas sp. QTF5 TaxID=1435425 RepID=UPI0004B46E2C|nr:winged helix-turn-helix domain-containing protein [Pseudomonas sp. QTF5]